MEYIRVKKLLDKQRNRSRTIFRFSTSNSKISACVKQISELLNSLCHLAYVLSSNVFVTI